MKQIIGLVAALCLVFTFHFADADASSFREVKQVTSSSLVVKDKASASAKTVGSLKRGEFVTVFSTTNGWAYVQGQTVKGYVNGAMLTKPKSTIKIASSKSGLVVKQAPSRNANTLATLKYNMIVEDFGSVGGGWSFVQYGNVTGYVASTFIGTPKTKKMYVHTASGVIVRNIASPSGQNIGSLKNETEVTVHSTIAGWAYVSAGSVRGYVVANMLTAKKPIVQITSGLMPSERLRLGYTTYNGYYSYVEDVFDISYIDGQQRAYFGDNYSPGGFLLYEQIAGGFLVGAGDYYQTIRYPLYVGKTWSYLLHDVIRQNYRVMSIGSLTTPAGSFQNVVRVRITSTYAGETDTTDLYFAPRYGVIRADYDGAKSYELTYISAY